MKTGRSLPLLLCLALAGCESTPASDSAMRPSLAAFQALHKGQTAAEVRAAVGEPAEIKPFVSTETGLSAEVWIYRRNVPGDERQVPIATRPVPAVNPVTGLPFTVNEPVYETQAATVVETVELLMVDGQLAQRKGRRQGDSRILFR